MAEDLSKYFSDLAATPVEKIKELDAEKLQELCMLAQQIIEGYKPGVQTSEFIVAAIAQLSGTLLVSGVLPGGWPAAVAGIVTAVTSAIAFIFWRKELKKEHLQKALEVIRLVTSLKAGQPKV